MVKNFIGASIANFGPSIQLIQIKLAIIKIITMEMTVIRTIHYYKQIMYPIRRTIILG